MINLIMNSEVDDGEMNQQKQQTGRGGESRDTEISKKKRNDYDNE